VPEVHFNQLELKWYWFDMLHYRRTGQFAQNLFNNAGDNQELQAFAYGYLSHIATDTVGHPFVNQVCGTAYRLDNWRHVTAENFMDAWKYSRYYNESVNKSLLDKLNLPEPDRLSINIVKLLVDTFRNTYRDDLHPLRLNNRRNLESYSEYDDTFGFYNEQNISDTYKAFYEVLELMEKSYLERPKEPFPEVDQILADALANAIPENPPPPPPPQGLNCRWEDIFGPNPLSSECARSFLQNAQNWINYVRDLLDWTSQTIRALIDAAVAVVAYIPMRNLVAILYGVQLLCYSIYRAFRQVWSFLGLLMPEPDELDWPIYRNLTQYEGLCSGPRKQNFPSRGFSQYNYNPEYGNLVCPPRNTEDPSTTGGFYAAPSDPDSFIGIGSQDFNLDNLKAYASANDPQQTRNLQGQNRNMGRAIPLATWMMLNTTTHQKKYVFTDWNLDSDRGYGSRAWHGFIPKEGDEGDFKVQVEQYCRESTIGDNCFAHFNPTVPLPSGDEEPHPDLVNAYLLTLACRWPYHDQLFVNPNKEDIAMYQYRFRLLFKRWGMDVGHFRFINRKGDNYDTEVVFMPYRDANKSFLIINFRGSEAPDIGDSFVHDWVRTDFYAVPEPVTLSPGTQQARLSTGFWGAFDPVKDEIINALKNFAGYRVWVTGNSLGGAVATICGLYLQLNGCPVEGVYTFAAPKVGDADFHHLYNTHLGNRCHRWVNGEGIDQDIATQLPPSTNPVYPLYEHVGKEHRVYENQPWLFKAGDPLTPPIIPPRSVIAHFTEGYARGIFKELLRNSRLANIAKSMPLPGA
jgi:hypothetical protein